MFAVMAEYGADSPFGGKEIDVALQARGVEMPFSDLDYHGETSRDAVIDMLAAQTQDATEEATQRLTRARRSRTRAQQPAQAPNLGDAPWAQGGGDNGPGDAGPASP